MREEAQQYYLKKLQTLPDAERRIFSRSEVDLKTIKRVHIVGTCGKATASLAGLLKEKGFVVSGSDSQCHPPMSTVLERTGLTLYSGWDEKHLEGANLVVIANMPGPDNPEVAFAREHNLPQLSLPETLKHLFLQGTRSLVVAGTHGKTTTSGMLAHVFCHAGRNPGYMIGGATQSGSPNFAAGGGTHFILEGDEYDTAYFDKAPKFLHYLPMKAVITSVEWDHVELYSTFEDYVQAFIFLTQEMPEEGELFLYGDSEQVRTIAHHATCPVRFYGMEESNDITARNVSTTPQGQAFDLIIDSENKGTYFIPMFGTHNLLNILAVCAMSLSEGITTEELRDALKAFRGMKQRQEVIGEVNGITVIDDFAHHPTAVRGTLQSIRQHFPARRLVAVFEPRTNTSRRKFSEKPYSESFDTADAVYLAQPAFRHNDTQSDFIDTKALAQAIKDRGIPAESFTSVDTLLQHLLKDLTTGDVCLIMSNGPFDNIREQLVTGLKKRV